MTIETQTRDVLLRAADEIEVQPPPVDALLGSAARRRRRIAAVVAGLSAAAVVVAVAIVSSRGGNAATPPTTPPPAPTTAPGTRLVGLNGVMASVPGAWANNRVKCGTPMGDTVIWDTDAVRLCQVVPRPEVSVLQIVDVGQNNSALVLAQQAHEPVTVGGREAYRMPTRPFAPSCPMSTQGHPVQCPYPRYEGTLYVPSLGVVLFASSPHRGVVDPILDSARLIPDGYVAIPVTTTANELEALGLRVDLPDGLGPDRVLPTDPEVGSVVAVGSTVSMIDTRVRACCIGSVVVELSRARAECGPTGGAMVTALASRAPLEDQVVLELVSEGRVVGRSDPTTLSSAVATGLSAVVSKPNDGSVDLYLRSWPDDDPASSMARIHNVSLRLPPGEVCY
ncbi:MAG TPA: hypothetical protein VLK34_04230 [Nocardioidaceae bacterium]|nr:hypothetical protein [Nocardioidaceae bacterium]